MPGLVINGETFEAVPLPTGPMTMNIEVDDIEIAIPSTRVEDDTKKSNVLAIRGKHSPQDTHI